MYALETDVVDQFWNVHADTFYKINTHKWTTGKEKQIFMHHFVYLQLCFLSWTPIRNTYPAIYRDISCVQLFDTL